MYIKFEFMKKVFLFICLLAASVAAHAQFEKGKWVLNPSITGLGLIHDTGSDKTSFGMEVKGGAFLLDNVALLISGGANWNENEGTRDRYTLGVGGRYYFSKIGIFLGGNVNVNRYNYEGGHDETDFSAGLEAGYAFFLSRTVTLEPSFFWDVDDDRSKFGLKVGFGFYF